MSRLSVLMILEGTYPFKSGGVSTWAHSLCNEIRGVDFTLYSMNAQFERTPLYELGSNIKQVIQVPLWSAHEPEDFLEKVKAYQKSIAKKEKLTNELVKKRFCPLFKNLLEFIFEEKKDMEYLDHLFYDLWLYFEQYDYKKTMKSPCVWRVYKEVALSHTNAQEQADTTLFDLTMGMQWVYRFLIPLGVTKIPKVDLVHLTLAGFSVIPALMAHHKHNAQIILTEHGVYIRERLLAIGRSNYSFFLKKLLIRFTECMTCFTYYKSDAIVSVNRFNQKWELAYGACPSKLKVIYNGIDTNTFVSSPKPEPLKEKPTVVAAARIFELKDILTMIRSCAVVVKEIPEVQYLIYGDYQAVPKYTAKCMALVETLNLSDNFKFMGARNDPEKIFPEGDVSILTSISEGFPYTVIESMACEVPVVATDVGGVAEALDEHTGILCKPKDPKAIGKAVISLLKNPEKRKTMGLNARQRVLENFSIEKFVTDYEQLYHTLTQENPPLALTEFEISFK